MLKHLARTLTISVALFTLITPAAFAELGADPEPGVVHAILAYLGLG